MKVVLKLRADGAGIPIFAQIAALMNALDRSGHPYADLYIVTLFTGMRQGEVLGLGWEDIDFRSGTILVHRQLLRLKERGAGYDYAEPKDHASRVIKPAPSVIDTAQAASHPSVGITACCGACMVQSHESGLYQRVWWASGSRHGIPAV